MSGKYIKELSPQENDILEVLRDLKPHCGRSWLNRIKDDRRRLTSINRYLATIGWTVHHEPCRGRYCDVKDCPLDMRQAMKLTENPAQTAKENIIFWGFDKAAAIV